MSHVAGSPSDTASAIRAAAAALDLDLAGEQTERLDRYVALLDRWNATYNLTAVRDAGRMVSHHIADCLAVVAPLRRELGAAATASVLDVGSGAGLPGIVLAAVNPTWRITCIDTVGKKAAFLRQVAADLALVNVSVVQGRVEDLSRAALFDAVVSRAFASLGDFVSTTTGLLAPNGRWMAMKGRIPTAELAALPPSVEVFHVEPLQVPSLGGERCLVWMRQNVRGTDKRAHT